ncbi:PhoU family transcriptional regulator, partial [Thermus scotoductus]
MGFLAGLALLLLGLHLIGEGLSSVKGKRYLLARAFSRPGSLLLSGLLLGLLSGSGTGLSLLALGLLEGGIFSLGQAALLSLAATAGAGAWVGVVALAQREVAEVLLALGLPLFLFRGSRSGGLVLLGLGLLFLGFLEMGQGAKAFAPLLSLLNPGPWALYLVGIVLAFFLGTANGVAALALAFMPFLGQEGSMALTLGAG